MQWPGGGGALGDVVAALQAASIGLSRIVALYNRSSILYQIHGHIRFLYI